MVRKNYTEQDRYRCGRISWNKVQGRSHEEIELLCTKEEDMIFNNRMKIHEEMVERVGWM